LLYLSRIHPKKGIERLLHAWQLLQDKHPDWRLEIVGRGEARYERELLDTCQALELRRVSMPGPKYGPEKSAAFFNAHLFVLPTHSENFGVAVAEALAHACPVVVSEGAPWSQLAANRCGWWTPNDVPNLADALHHAMTLPSDERVQMGLLGREWMARDFSWDIIARQMAECYSWILSGGDPPTCITTQSSTTALRA
jgi:glycosyltransferase involved in cell wall biosynthesis